MHSFIKTTTTALQAMVLSVLFAGAAYGADSVDINTADAQTIEEKAQVCAACHGENGVPPQQQFPVPAI